jgi:hypothetical protein
MAHPLIWPGKTFFYPIGNTTAINLAQDLTPEEPAKLLLLGCGDPRNILYTIYAASANCEHSSCYPFFTSNTHESRRDQQFPEAMTSHVVIWSQLCWVRNTMISFQLLLNLKLS